MRPSSFVECLAGGAGEAVFHPRAKGDRARWPIQFRQEATSRAARTNAPAAATSLRFPERRIYRHARSAATATTRRSRAAIAETIPIRKASNLAAANLPTPERPYRDERHEPDSREATSVSAASLASGSS